MKTNKILIIFILLCSFHAFSQEENTSLETETASVEKSMFSVQAGLLPGVWINEEIKLANPISLRFEAGANYGTGSGGFTDNGTISVWVANFRLEPRYYYNLGRRIGKGKDISNNSGNFLALAFNYVPKDGILFSNTQNLMVSNSFTFVPNYGIRRNIGKNFNYETGFGVGLYYVPPDSRSFGAKQSSGIIVELHLRIGYTF
ncbi:MAG: hypothetical protein LBE36_05275 [Flavobacteriaceae bacterium]|jgi:hypothetical protein|nr:hypothetical protein [Flavobacteriaceae bacterium]